MYNAGPIVCVSPYASTSKVNIWKMKRLKWAAQRE